MEPSSIQIWLKVTQNPSMEFCVTKPFTTVIIDNYFNVL